MTDELRLELTQKALEIADYVNQNDVEMAVNVLIVELGLAREEGRSK